MDYFTIFFAVVLFFRRRLHCMAEVIKRQKVARKSLTVLHHGHNRFPLDDRHPLHRCLDLVANAQRPTLTQAERHAAGSEKSMCFPISFRLL